MSKGAEIVAAHQHQGVAFRFDELVDLVRGEADDEEGDQSLEIEDPAAIPALESALRAEKNNKDLQIAYIKALAATGEKSVDALKSLLESTDPEIKSIAVRALAGGHATGPWPWPWPEPRPFPE